MALYFGDKLIEFFFSSDLFLTYKYYYPVYLSYSSDIFFALCQILNTDMPREDGSLVIHAGDISEEVTNGPQKSLVVEGECEYHVDKSDGSKSFDPPMQSDLHAGSLNHGYAVESSNTMDLGMDFLLDEPYFDATDGAFPLDDSLFFQADDLKNAADMDYGLDMLNEYTSLFNPDVGNFPYTFDSIENKNIPDSMLTIEVVKFGIKFSLLAYVAILTHSIINGPIWVVFF